MRAVAPLRLDLQQCTFVCNAARAYAHTRMHRLRTAVPARGSNELEVGARGARGGCAGCAGGGRRRHVANPAAKAAARVASWRPWQQRPRAGPWRRRPWTPGRPAGREWAANPAPAPPSWPPRSTACSRRRQRCSACLQGAAVRRGGPVSAARGAPAPASANFACSILCASLAIFMALQSNGDRVKWPGKSHMVPVGL